MHSQQHGTTWHSCARAHTYTHTHLTSPGGCPPGFFCFAGCPFLMAWALASLALSAKRCWAGVIGYSHLAMGLELEGA
eukprot:1141822-Pelagomonas_calceolata.AAC.2